MSVGPGDAVAGGAVAPVAAGDPVRVQVRDSSTMTALFGQQDEHLKIVEKATGVRLVVQGDTIEVRGDAVQSELAARILRQLSGLVEAGYPLYPADVKYAGRILSGDRGANLHEIFLHTIYI